MSTTAIVLIIVGAIVLVALIAFASQRTRERRLQARREHAGELRETAQAHSLKAERERAVAAERLNVAERQADLAREHEQRADELDPDVELEPDDDREVVSENGHTAPAETGRPTA